MSILPEVVEFKHLNGRVIKAGEIMGDTLHVEQTLQRTGLDRNGLPTGNVHVMARWEMNRMGAAPAVGDVVILDPKVLNLQIRRVDETFMLRVIRVYLHKYKSGRFADVVEIDAEGVWLDGTYVIDWITQTPYEELRKRSRAEDPQARRRAIEMARKVKRLMERPGTPGEGAAAAAALQRLMEAADLKEEDLR